MTRWILFSVFSLSICFAEKPKFETFNGHPYYTHQPVLYEIAANTDGPIIEFGSGEGSTRILHEICKKMNRTLITLDDDKGWLRRYQREFFGDGYELDNSGWHKIYYVPGKGKRGYQDEKHWDAFIKKHPEIFEATYSLCFIDQGSWVSRADTAKRFAKKATYVVMHDADYFPEHGLLGNVIQSLDEETSTPGKYDFSDYFTHFKVYFPAKPWPGPTGPPTMAGSNFTDDLPDIEYASY